MYNISVHMYPSLSTFKRLFSHSHIPLSYVNVSFHIDTSLYTLTSLSTCTTSLSTGKHIFPHLRISFSYVHVFFPHTSLSPCKFFFFLFTRVFSCVYAFTQFFPRVHLSYCFHTSPFSTLLFCWSLLYTHNSCVEAYYHHADAVLDG